MTFNMISFFCSAAATAICLTGCSSFISAVSAVASSPSSDLPAIKIEANIQEPVPFVRREDPRPGRSYVAKNIPVTPVAQIRESIEKKIQKGLVRRTQAHITVITPPEVVALSSCLTIEQLSEMAEKENLQAQEFKPVCVGKGSKKEEFKDMQTYFVVVDFEAGFQFRKKVAELCTGKTDPQLFDPNRYYPHITVGFTHQDLHLEDGIVKSAQSCAFSFTNGG